MPEGENNFTNLFLAEFLVESVHYVASKIKLDEETKNNLGQTCVRFYFLNYPPIQVCEQDFCDSAAPLQDADIIFGSGKSCLFSLGRALAQRSITVSIKVLRQLKTSGSVEIGCACINLGSNFTELLTSGHQSSSPAKSEVLKSTCTIKDGSGDEVGSVTVFLRLSSFGNIIVTQFQAGGTENKSFLFKGATENPQGIMGSRSLWNTQTGNDGITDCRSFMASGGGAYGPGRGMMMVQSSFQLYQTTGTPVGQQFLGQGGYGGVSNINPYSPNYYAPNYFGGQPTFQGLGLEGYNTKPAYGEAHVEKKYPNIKQSEWPGCGRLPTNADSPDLAHNTKPCPFEMREDVQYCMHEDCPMNYPQPPFLQMINVPAPEPPCIEEMELPPGTVAMKGNQVIFQMNDKPTSNNAVYQFGVNEPGNKKRTVQVLGVPPPGDREPENDDENDMFLIKVGKRNPYTEQKAKLEVELKAPKLKEDKIITQDNTTQYNIDDVPQEASPQKKADKEKNGGGKAKKGGKKGKKK